MKAIRRSLNRYPLFSILLVLCVLVSAVAYAVHRPSNSNVNSSLAQFKHSNPFVANFVMDRPTVWVNLAPANAIVASLVGMGGGTPAVAEINTSEIGGFTLDANDESVSGIIPIPGDMDLAQDFQCRVLYSNSEAAATGTINFTMTYGSLTVGTDALAVAATAVDTAGAALADLGANVLQWSNYSIIAGGTLTDTPIDDVLVIKEAVTLVTCANATVYGIQCQYYRKWLGMDNL